MPPIKIAVPAGATEVLVDFTVAETPPPAPPSPPVTPPAPPPVSPPPAPPPEAFAVAAAAAPVTLATPKLTAGRHTVFFVGRLTRPGYGWTNIVNAPGVLSLYANQAAVIVNGRMSVQNHPWSKLRLFVVEYDGGAYTVRLDGLTLERGALQDEKSTHLWGVNFGQAIGSITPFQGDWRVCEIHRDLTEAQRVARENALLNEFGIGGVVEASPVPPSPQPVGARLNRAGLAQTFADEFDAPDWIASKLHNPYTGANPRGWKSYFGEYDSNPDGFANRGFNDEFQHYIDPHWSAKNHPEASQFPTIEVSNGTLKLRAFRADAALRAKLPGQRRYVSGCLSTFDVFSQIGGVWEARMKLPRGAGPWPAFWTVTRQQTPGGPFVELDIMESWQGVTPGAYVATHHNWFDADRSRAKTVPLGDLNDAFHVYTVEVGRDFTVFYLDDVEVLRRATPPQSLQYPSHLYLNLAVGASWLPVNDADLPATFEIDWVRVWRRT